MMKANLFRLHVNEICKWGLVVRRVEREDFHRRLVYLPRPSPTILMQLFSWNVVERSVTISWAMISTALASRPCFLTKSSLASTAAPAPSDVGLNTHTHTLKMFLHKTDLALRCMSSLWATYQHWRSVRNSKTLRDLITCSRLYSSWNWEYLRRAKSDDVALLDVLLTDQAFNLRRQAPIMDASHHSDASFWLVYLLKNEQGYG